MEKYRVVCSQEKFSDNIFVDIAPDNGTTHEQILFSRNQLHNKNCSEKLDLLVGSIYLHDENGDINVIFPKPQVPEHRYLEYQGIIKRYEFLREKIISTYKKMKEDGHNSTLVLYSHSMMNAILNNDDDKQLTFDTDKISYAQKHLYNQKDTFCPQNLQQETNQQQIDEFLQICQRRAAGIQNRARQDALQDPISRMREKYKTYSGD